MALRHTDEYFPFNFSTRQTNTENDAQRRARWMNEKWKCRKLTYVNTLTQANERASTNQVEWTASIRWFRCEFVLCEAKIVTKSNNKFFNGYYYYSLRKWPRGYLLLFRVIMWTFVRRPAVAKCLLWRRWRRDCRRMKKINSTETNVGCRISSPSCHG